MEAPWEGVWCVLWGDVFSASLWLLGEEQAGRHQQKQGNQLGDGEKWSDFRSIKKYSQQHLGQIVRLSGFFPYLNIVHSSPRSGSGGGEELSLAGWWGKEQRHLWPHCGGLGSWGYRHVHV